jgi:membrane fusion protein (multidrug efflux system)
MRQLIQKLPLPFKPTLIIAGCILVVIVIALAVPKRDDTQPPTTPPPVAVDVEVVEPVDDFHDDFVIPGVVEPNRVVRVAAEVAARIEEFAGFDDRIGEDFTPIKGSASAGQIEEGVRVTAGQPLMYLNTDLVLARRDEAKANFDYQRREFERIKTLFEKKVATASEVDAARVKYNTAKALLEVAEANLERSIVVSPINGILNSLPVEVGEYVNPGMVVAEIVDLDVMKVVVDVPEKDVGFLKIGQEETIHYGLNQRKEVTGKICYISELADQATRTTRVEICVDNKDRILRSGQIVQANLLRRVMDDVIMIPLQAVIPLEEGYVVYLSDGKEALRREVTLDRNVFQGQHIRVTEGLASGDRLIVRGHRLLSPGQPIREKSDQPTSAPATLPANRPAGASDDDHQ